MTFILGTDEAGYGPNLGPLVVAASLWEIPDGLDGGDLYRTLRGCVARESGGRWPRAVIADSKTIYQSGKGLAGLEAGVWPTLALLGLRPQSWRRAWEQLAPGDLAKACPAPWYQDYDCPLPHAATCAQLQELAERLEGGLSRAGVRLCGLRCRAIFPDQFNRLLDQHGSKGTALSQITLGLASEMLTAVSTGSIVVFCDKHGGRNQYQALLQEQFPEWLVEVHGEGPRLSVYRSGPHQRRVEWRFVVGGEAYLPVALASMAAKYLRELAMLAWNAFWCARLPDLVPTAGYPGDAQRFFTDIAAARQELNLPDNLLWRKR